MNKLELIGNLVRDPETKTSESGKSFVSFSIGVKRYSKKTKNGEYETDFFGVTLSDFIAQRGIRYLHKGSKVYVAGTVSCHVYANKGGQYKAQMNVYATEMEFLGNGTVGRAEDADTGAGGESHSAPADPMESSGFIPVDEEELPF